MVAASTRMLQTRPRSAKIIEGPFWRRDDPEMDETGVVRGGMWQHQRDWWALPNFVRLMVTGYGGGKTLTFCKRMIDLALINAPAPVAMVSPTYTMALDTTIATTAELLEGKRSLLGKALWWDYNQNRHLFVIRYGGRVGHLKVYSGDNPLRLRGPNLAAAGIDEPFIQAAEVFKQLVARVRHPRAKRKEINLTGCVHPDTLILPATGMIPIKVLDPGDLPVKGYGEIDASVSGLSGQFQKATRFFNNGEAETIKLFAQGGYSLEATTNHQVWVMGANGLPVWRRLDELTESDHVALGRGANVWPGRDPSIGFKPSPATHRNKNTLPRGYKMTDVMAYFLGLWVAEGSLDGLGRVRISCTEKVKDLLRDGVDGLKATPVPRRPEQVNLNSVHLIEYMRHIGMPMVLAPHKTLPAWVGQGRESWARAFLSGLYDGDGHVSGPSIGLSSSSEALIDGVQCLLLNFGVVTTKTYKKTPPTERVKVWSEGWQLKASHADSVKLARLLTFQIERKQQAAQALVFDRVNDGVPHQKSLILEAWRARSKKRWRTQAGRLEPNKIIEQANNTTVLSYPTLADFVSYWEENEGALIRPVRQIQQNIDDHYKWAPVQRLSPGRCQTVDLCVPETHAYWSNGFISHNTPEQLNWGYDLAIGDPDFGTYDVGMVQASTAANRALGQDYVTRLLGSLSDKEAEAYVSGQFINLSTGLIFHAFSPEANVMRLRPPDGAVWGAGMDFNVDPMAAVVFWHTKDHIHVVDVIEIANSDTQEMCGHLREHYPKIQTVYPDPSGRQRRSSAPGGKTDFHYIKQAGFEIDAPLAHDPLRDSRNAVNGALRPSVGLPRMTISPECKKLIKYLGLYSHELLNKQKDMSHALDAMRYPVARLMPVLRGTGGVRRLHGA